MVAATEAAPYIPKSQNGQQNDAPAASWKDEILSLMRQLRTAREGIEDAGASHSENGNPTEPEGRQPAGRVPRFGDLSCCGVKGEAEKRLWELEASRLVDGIADAHTPPSMPEYPVGKDHDEMSSIGDSGFTRIERLASQLMYALAICGLDDQTVGAGYPQTKQATNRLVLLRSCQKLLSIYRKETATLTAVHKAHELKGRTQSGQAYDGRISLEDGPAVTEAEIPSYYCLVDYITATLARVIAVGLESHRIYWAGMVITALAKLGTKLKVLSQDLPKHRVDALRRHDPNTLRQFEMTHDDDGASDTLSRWLTWIRMLNNPLRPWTRMSPPMP